MTIRFEPLAERHVGDATTLALSAFARERVPALAAEGVPTVLRRAVADLIQRGTGVAALDGDRLMGYLAFYGPIEGFWSSGIRCFAPLHGIAVSGNARSRLASRLFQHAAEPMVAQGVEIFAISTYRHDGEVAEGLAVNGFGIRNADAIRMEGIRRIGVDVETTNPSALHFWTKSFERYTSSFARRIDVVL